MWSVTVCINKYSSKSYNEEQYLLFFNIFILSTSNISEISININQNMKTLQWMPGGRFAWYNYFIVIDQLLKVPWRLYHDCIRNIHWWQPRISCWVVFSTWLWKIQLQKRLDSDSITVDWGISKRPGVKKCFPFIHRFPSKSIHLVCADSKLVNWYQATYIFTILYQKKNNMKFIINTKSIPVLWCPGTST